MKLPENDPWKRFFDVPITGNAKMLAIRLAREPYVDDTVLPRNIRDFSDEMRLFVWEMESAYRELWDPRVGWVTSSQYDRPVLKKDCFVRKLVEAQAPPQPQQAPLQQGSRLGAALKFKGTPQ